MLIKCFYHSADLDGHASGAIVKYKYPEAMMYPINYGDEFPWNDIQADDVVYMVDFALQPFDPEMTYLASRTNLVWIDHHSSAIKEYEKWYHKQSTPALDYMLFEGERNTSKAACELTWEYFFEDTPVPLAIKLLSLYDSWTYQGHELEEMVLPFQIRMRMEDLDPKDWDSDPTVCNRWLDLFGETVSEEEQPFEDKDIIESLIKEGKLLLRYDEQQKKKYARTYAFETWIHDPDRGDTLAIAVNLGHTNSKVFDSLWDGSKYDIMITFVRRSDQQWNVSLYSTKDEVDCGAIAKSLGGGGHKGAAGFQCKELPFEY